MVLEEIGQLPAQLQRTLLDALNDGHFTPAGGEVLSLEARVIASTQTDLREAVNSRRFRSDLFYRLSAVKIRVPPLRERREDIPSLVELFYSAVTDDEDSAPPGELLDRLFWRPWPGNVRELENAVERAVVLTKGSAIDYDLLPESLQRGSGLQVRGNEGIQFNGHSLPEMVQDYERRVIRESLEQAGGRQTEAAEKLKIPLSTLNQKIKRLNIVPPRRGGV